MADQAVSLIPGADGALVGLWDGNRYVTFVSGSGHLSELVGAKLQVEGSVTGLAIESGRVVLSEDTAVDPRADTAECRRREIASAVCVPLARDGRTFGALVVASRTPRAIARCHANTLEGLADFVSVVVGAAADLDRATSALLSDRPHLLGGPGPAAQHRPGRQPTPAGGWPDHLDERPGHLDERPGHLEGTFVANILNPLDAHHDAARRRIEGVIRERAIHTVFQPVVDLTSRQVVGYEALSRFPQQPERAPDLWFNEAHELGLGVELELAAVEIALTHLHELPPDVLLGINVGPDAIADPRVVRLLRSVGADRIIVEITEHAEVDDYPHLVDALADLDRAGVLLAVDDTGSGISSLAHILELAPEVIKLDRALTTGIDRDPVRRALAGSLVAFAAETRSVIVAEGIETPGELQVLRNLGVRYGQGFHLGMPSGLEELPTSA